MDTLFSNNKCSKKNNITSSWFHILKDIIDNSQNNTIKFPTEVFVQTNHLKKYGIKKRTKSQAVKLMLQRDWTSKAKKHVITTKFGTFKLKSDKELNFIIKDL